MPRKVKLKPTPANLKAASRHREAILDAIAHGTFDYKYTFPDSLGQHSSSRAWRQDQYKDYHLDRWVTRLERQNSKPAPI